MNKFDIFKLLTSLYTQKKGENNDNLPEIKKEIDQPKKEIQENRPSPLQISMLSTINSHDKFVERVMKNK